MTLFVVAVVGYCYHNRRLASEVAAVGASEAIVPAWRRRSRRRCARRKSECTEAAAAQA